MERIRMGLRRLGKDVYQLRFALLGIGGYYVTVHLLFGQFCPMMIIAHLPCPGCGMTRAFLLVLMGHYKEAWELQPLVYGWILFGGIFGMNRYLLNKEQRRFTGLLMLLILATIFFYVYRIGTGFPVELKWEP